VLTPFLSSNLEIYGKKDVSKTSCLLLTDAIPWPSIKNLNHSSRIIVICFVSKPTLRDEGICIFPSAFVVTCCPVIHANYCLFLKSVSSIVFTSHPLIKWWLMGRPTPPGTISPHITFPPGMVILRTVSGAAGNRRRASKMTAFWYLKLFTDVKSISDSDKKAVRISSVSILSLIGLQRRWYIAPCN
jgi:hypothetical protein